MSISRTIYQPLATACMAGCVSIGALFLTACSSPPKPPSVDESTKRPVNAKVAVDLKSCQADLSHATTLVSEMARAGIVTTALTLSRPLPVATTANVADPATAGAVGHLVAVVPFAMGSASWSVEAADAVALVRHAQSAALIMIRGRTDAQSDSPQETALARQRAESAAEFLQRAGVPKDKLRLTWQGAGDPVAGLHPSEHAQSRRVEIEFYPSAPVLVSLRSGVATAKGATAASL
jgi:outer membrane protein OmpA-like peptidoglycan-associated protein